MSWAFGMPSSSLIAESCTNCFVGSWRREAERAGAFGDEVHREGELVVLRLEHQVQRLEHRPCYVPVEVVGLELERVRVRKDAR
jgi:hypothetical protein